MSTTIIGHVDSLGYLFCQDCKPVHACMGCTGIVWSDSAPHKDEDCEICHRTLAHVEALRIDRAAGLGVAGSRAVTAYLTA